MAKLTELTGREQEEYNKLLSFNLAYGMTEDEAKRVAWDELQLRFPSLRPYDGVVA